MRVLIAVALLMMCTALAQRIEPAPKQEKAPPSSGTGIMTIAPPPACKDAKFGEMCISKDGWFMRNLPFDLPAKEWDYTDCSISPECVITAGKSQVVLSGRRYSCKDVAPDWKQRVLLDSADGKHHCYAFYLLEQKP